MESNSINNNNKGNMNPGFSFHENDEHLENYNENANLMNFLNNEKNNNNGNDLFNKNTNENINIDDMI